MKMISVGYLVLLGWLLWTYPVATAIGLAVCAVVGVFMFSVVLRDEDQCETEGREEGDLQTPMHERMERSRASEDRKQWGVM